MMEMSTGITICSVSTSHTHTSCKRRSERICNASSNRIHAYAYTIVIFHRFPQTSGECLTRSTNPSTIRGCQITHPTVETGRKCYVFIICLPGGTVKNDAKFERRMPQIISNHWQELRGVCIFDATCV